MAAGEQLIARGGYESVNSNQIARAAHVGVGTFYRHFDDKSALVQALTLQAWEELGREMPGTEVEDALEFARLATRAVVDYAQRSPERFRVAFGRSRPALRAGAAVSLSVRPIERRLRALADRGLLAAALDPALAARAWWAMISGTVGWWLEGRDPVPAQELVETLVALHPAVAAARPGDSP